MRYGKHFYTWQHWLQGTRTTETLESEFRSSAASPGAEATWRTVMTNCLSPAIVYGQQRPDVLTTARCTDEQQAGLKTNRTVAINTLLLCVGHSMADTDCTDWFRGFPQSLRAHGTADDTITSVPSSRSTVLTHWSADERRTFLPNKTGQ
jgi:hypothetical protein